MRRPGWVDYLMGLARCVSQRSHDAQTKHGCVIANDRHQVLGVGYNGFPRGMDDDSLPTTRPEKYPWMDHSEENAVANCVMRPEGATAYVTGKACLACLKEMWRHGIKEVVEVDGHGWTKDDEEVSLRETFLKQTGMKVTQVTPNLSWLVEMVLRDPQLSFYLCRKLEKETWVVDLVLGEPTLRERVREKLAEQGSDYFTGPTPS